MLVKGSTAIVTGSGGDIGRAIARELAVRGAAVVCASLDDAGLRETARLVQASSGDALVAPADVTDRAQVEHMAAQALDTYGHIDILVNNAGIFHAIGGLWEVDPETWRTDVMTNLFGSFLCCRAVLPHMMAQNHGIIINMAGGGYDRPNAGGTGYAASKAGLMRMTDTLAAELGERCEVQVYGLWPGFVRSAMTRLLAESEQGRRWLPHVGDGLNRGEDHPAEDIGHAVVKLIEISRPALSGRIFSYDDDFDWIAKHANEIQQHDWHQLRMRRGDDKGTYTG